MFSIKRCILSGLAAFFVMAPGAGLQEAPAAGKTLPQGQEEELGVMSAGAKRVLYLASRNAGGFAWVEKAASLQKAFLNGKQMGAAYARIDKLSVSDDGEHLAFAGKHGDWWNLLIDGRKSEFIYAQIQSVWLRRDGLRSIALGLRESRWRVIVDGIEDPQSYEEIGTLTSGEDLFAFAGKRESKWYPVIDGREEPLACDGIIFMETPSGRPPLCVVQRDHKYQILVGGEVKAESSQPFARLAIKRDGQRFLYVRSSKELLAMDIVLPDGSSLEVPALVQQLSFIGDSEHWVAAVRKQDSYHYIVDGQWGPPATALGPFRATPDGLHWAYGAAVDNDVIIKKYAEGFIIQDGQEIGRARGAPYDHILDLYNRKRRGILDLTSGILESLSFRIHGVGSSVLTPDGAEMAYFRFGAPEDKKVRFCRNGRCSDPYDDAANLIYTGPSGGWMYTVRKGTTVSIMRNDAAIGDVPAEWGFGESYGTSLSKNVGLIPSPEGRRYILVVQQITLVPEASLFQPPLWRTIYIDGQAAFKIRAEYFAHLGFSEDGSHWTGIVINARPEGKSFVLADGGEGAHYDEIIPESFSANGNDGIRFIARMGNRFLRVTQPWP